MKTSLFGIYGASGYGRETMPLARELLRGRRTPPARLVFIDDGATQKEINGHRALRFEEFLQENAHERRVAIAIASGQVREKLAARCAAEGVGFWPIVAKNAVIMDAVELGEGAIISPFVTLTSNVKIGQHFHANIYSYVAHDCLIGDFVTFAPAVKCNGNIVVEDHAYIGTGAVLKQGQPGKPLIIGRGAVVGMGAVVTRDVPPGTTVVGNPARPLAK